MIWLIGCNGMLGSELLHLLEEHDLKHVATDAELDITAKEDVRAFVQTQSPDWIINCAAYTAVDQAESNEDRAHALNADAAGHVATAASSGNAQLIHISTDYVFDGAQAAPYAETAPTRPLSAYGRSKEAGERLVRERCSQSYIVRTAWLHGTGGHSFVSTMLRLMSTRSELSIVDDQLGSPTYAVDLAAALLTIVRADKASHGTYHYTNAGACTWHGFATEIQRQGLARGLLNTAIPLNGIGTSEYPTPARRPQNSVLSLERAQSVFGVATPTWQDGLERHLGRLEESSPTK